MTTRTCAAALMWESWAATMAPTPAVAQVSTGAQSVSYGRAVPSGDLGLADGPRGVAQVLQATRAAARAVLRYERRPRHGDS